MEALYEIWVWLAQRFLRKWLKSVDNRRTMDGRQTTEAYLSYKLTSEPSAQES